jgi:hypothetical protein
MKRLFIAFALLWPGLAHAVVSLGDPLPNHLFTFSTQGGLQNPEVIVGFNPQPDPPVTPWAGQLDLGNPAAPALLLPAVRGTYGLLIGLLIPGNPVHGLTPAAAPNGDGRTSFNASFGDGSVFKVNIGIGGFMGDWVALNPQPLPPRLLPGSVAFYGFTGDPSASISIAQIDPNGALLPLSFTLVPEPAGLALLALPLLLTAAMAGRRPRPASAR